MISELQNIVVEIQRVHGLTPRQIFETSEKDILLPVTMFANRSLGVLETLVKFLKENHNMTFAEIARSLNRDNRTIWATYHKARIKAPYRLVQLPGPVIPAKAFEDRSKSALESLVKYCKQTLQLTNPEIAKLINRNNRTVWAVVNK